MNIVDQSYWNDSYSQLKIEEVSIEHPIAQLLAKYLKEPKENDSAFEIGCYPGGFLLLLERFGYTISGVDLCPQVTSLEKYCKEKKRNYDFFIQSDLFTFNTDKKFNLVCSFGFIEHFTDWDNVIVEHFRFLKNGGTLCICTPNFKYGLQRVYHKLFDSDNLKRHITHAMDPKDWEEILRANNFEVISSGYVGDIFWNEGVLRNIFSRILRQLIILASKISNRIFGLSKNTASYSYVIAQKK